MDCGGDTDIGSFMDCNNSLLSANLLEKAGDLEQVTALFDNAPDKGNVDLGFFQNALSQYSDQHGVDYASVVKSMVEKLPQLLNNPWVSRLKDTFQKAFRGLRGDSHSDSHDPGYGSGPTYGESSGMQPGTAPTNPQHGAPMNVDRPQEQAVVAPVEVAQTGEFEQEESHDEHPSQEEEHSEPETEHEASEHEEHTETGTEDDHDHASSEKEETEPEDEQYSDRH